MADIGHHDPSIVEINVGYVLHQLTKILFLHFSYFCRGHIFLTTVQTLQREASVLTSVPPRHDKDGRIFIDRDPTYFRWILNYLRY